MVLGKQELPTSQSSWRASFITRKFLKDAIFLQFPSSDSSNPPPEPKFRYLPTNPEPQTDQRPHVLIVAYSGRALAHAAKAASLYATVVDQFCDSDTMAIADATLRLNFPPERANAKLESACKPLRKLFRQPSAILGGLPPISGVLLGGGCENRPSLIQQIQSFAGETQQLGLPSPKSLEQLRDRQFYRSAAEHAGCGFPTSMSVKSFSADQPHTDQRAWLLKSPNSAGGLGVQRIATGQRLPTSLHSKQYCQQLIPGRQLGVTLIVGPSGTRLAGCTESLSQRDWQPTAPARHLNEFLYRGSWGPIELSSQQAAQVLRIGDYCASRTGWQGWLQADFIEDASRQLWLLEINPRWTAGMEVLVRAGVCNPVTEHLKALGRNIAAGPSSAQARCAKAVWYADRDLTAAQLHAAATRAQSKLNALSPAGSREFLLCDIPSPTGDPVLTGHPGLTVVVKHSISPESQSQLRTNLLSHLNTAHHTLLSCL